jgi:nitrous oxidase accessory protein
MAATPTVTRVVAIASIVIFAASGSPLAAIVRVGPGTHHECIADAIRAAASGDTVVVSGGVYPEHGIVVDKAILLMGSRDAVIDADNQGEIITVTADGVTVRGLILRNVGNSFTEDRAGIRLRGVRNVTVEDNHLEKAFFGIYVEHGDSILIRGNTLKGSSERETANGNGIHLWNSKRVRIEDNHVSGHRDGIYFEFVEYSDVVRNVSTDNMRYGLHFMFSHHDTYVGNRFARNGAGVAVMYTRDVSMHDNEFADNWGSNAYGLLLKDIIDSSVLDNSFTGNTVAVYMEGCNRIDIAGNRLRRNGYAIRLMANSMQNSFSGNDFEGNAFDVVTNSRQNFNTFDANYWDEYRGYDLDRDGVGDVPHAPVRLFALLIEKAPPGVILMKSLFVSLLDTAERVMPVFTPETLVDSNPRMNPTVTPGSSLTARARSQP